MTSDAPTFSIVTPTYNMRDYLACCAASIADQENARFEHIVVDGASTDGTPEWLAEQQGLRFLSEPDKGMYDALNKGFRMARGAYVSYLNCDEQYLPGTLAKVQAFFEAHPDVDIVFGGALLVKPEGELISFRKAYPLRRTYVLVDHLYLLSCTMFLRRKAIDNGFYLDENLKDVGDGELVCRLMKAGYKVGIIRDYLSTFCMTGNNMSMGENALRERDEIRKTAPAWARPIAPLLNVARRLEKWACGGYRERFPLEYAMYPLSDPSARKSHSAASASFRWLSE